MFSNVVSQRSDQSSIEPFYLPVGLWVISRGIRIFDTQSLASVLKEACVELFTIIGEQICRGSICKDPVVHKGRCDGGGRNSFQRDGSYQLGEPVLDDENKMLPSISFDEFP